MPHNFYFGKGADIVAGSANFASKIGTGFASYGLTSAQSTAFGVLDTALQAAWTASVDPSTRTRVTIMAKDQAIHNMRASAIQLSKIIYATSTVTNSMLAGLGLLPRTARTPIPAPGTKPSLIVKGVSGKTVTVMLRGPDANKRAKPAGVQRADVYSYIGATAPSDITLFKYEGGTTRTTFDVQFPNTTAGGAQVWLTAQWVNERSQTGPACDPVTTYLQGGGSVSTEAA